MLGGLALAAVAVPFAVTCALFFGFAEPEVVRYFTWLEAGALRVDFAYRIDQLSLLDDDDRHRGRLADPPVLDWVHER